VAKKTMPTHLIQQQQQLRASPAHICCSKIINLLTPNEQNPLHDPICSKVWVTQTNKQAHLERNVGETTTIRNLLDL
jgi:hypothetical protein